MRTPTYGHRIVERYKAAIRGLPAGSPGLDRPPKQIVPRDRDGGLSPDRRRGTTYIAPAANEQTSHAAAPSPRHHDRDSLSRGTPPGSGTLQKLIVRSRQYRQLAALIVLTADPLTR